MRSMFDEMLPIHARLAASLIQYVNRVKNSVQTAMTNAANVALPSGR